MDPLSRDLEKGEPDGNAPDTRQSLDNVGRAFGASPRSSLRSSSSAGSQSSLGNDYLSRIRTASTLRGSAIALYPTAASRIATQRSQHIATVGADPKARAERAPLPEFGAGKPYPRPLPEKEDYVVEFTGPDDPLHPQNWSTKKK